MNPIGSIHPVRGAAVPLTLDQGGPDSRRAELLRLRCAVADFEGLFIAHMLKSMQNTIPEAQKGLLSGGDVLQDVGWEKVAESMARKGGLGLGDLLYESLKDRVMVDSIPGGADAPSVSGPGNPPEAVPAIERQPASPRPLDHIRQTFPAHPVLDAGSHASDKGSDVQYDPMQ